MYFSFRKTTLRYVSPSRDLQILLAINFYFLIYILIYFFVYLGWGARFEILTFEIEIQIWDWIWVSFGSFNTRDNCIGNFVWMFIFLTNEFWYAELALWVKSKVQLKVPKCSLIRRKKLPPCLSQVCFTQPHRKLWLNV